MEISLRKANAIQAAIVDKLREIDSELIFGVELTEFQDAKAAITAAQEALQRNISRKLNLLDVQCNIRGLVGKANAASDVNEILTVCAGLDRQLALFNEVLKHKVVSDVSVVESQLKKLATSTTQSLYKNSVSASAMREETLLYAKERRYVIMKMKQDLNDKLLELNIRIKITLSEDAVEVLKTEGLI